MDTPAEMVATLRELLAMGMDPNGDSPDSSPLLEALRLESEAMVGISPLVAALNARMTRLLTRAGARVPRESGRSYIWSKTMNFPGYSLHDAAGQGDAERLRVLLEEGEGAAMLETYDFLGHTPVGVAARQGHPEALRLLLEHGGDPNGCSREEIAHTPLAYVTNVECARLLLEHGADPDHAWGLCATGRQELTQQGGEMLLLLEEADRHPERRRLTPESVRRRLVSHIGWEAQEPSLHQLAGRQVWVFGSLSGPSLAWNWKWGVVVGGKVRWQPDYASARRLTVL